MASKFAKQTNETIDIVWKGDAGINERGDRLGRSWFNQLNESVDIMWKGDASINERRDRSGQSKPKLMKVSILSCPKLFPHHCLCLTLGTDSSHPNGGAL